MISEYIFVSELNLMSLKSNTTAKSQRNLTAMTAYSIYLFVNSLTQDIDVQVVDEILWKKNLVTPTLYAVFFNIEMTFEFDDGHME